MLNTTLKLSNNGNLTSIGSAFFYRKHKDFVYYSRTQCKSIEELVDRIVPDMDSTVFIYEDFKKQNKIYLVNTHSSTNTIIVDAENADFTTEKLIEKIKILAMQCTARRIYIAEDSKFKELLESENLFQDISIVKIPVGIFKSTYRKMPKLKMRTFYIAKSMAILSVLVIITFANKQYYKAKSEQAGSDYNTAYGKLEKRKKVASEKLASYNSLNNKQTKIRVAKNINEVLLSYRNAK